MDKRVQGKHNLKFSWNSISCFKNELFFSKMYYKLRSVKKINSEPKKDSGVQNNQMDTIFI